MGGGYSAWVDSGLAGDKPPEELKTACKFRPWNADWYTLFVCRSQSICMDMITVKFNGFEQRRKNETKDKRVQCMIVWKIVLYDNSSRYYQVHFFLIPLQQKCLYK